MTTDSRWAGLPTDLTRRVITSLNDSLKDQQQRITPLVSSLQRQAATMAPVAQALQWAGLGADQAADAAWANFATDLPPSPWAGHAHKQMRGLQATAVEPEPVVAPLDVRACLKHLHARQVVQTLNRYPSLFAHVSPEVLARAAQPSPLAPVQQRLHALRVHQTRLHHQLERHMGLRGADMGDLDFPDDL